MESLRSFRFVWVFALRVVVVIVSFILLVGVMGSSPERVDGYLYVSYRYFVGAGLMVSFAVFTLISFVNTLCGRELDLKSLRVNVPFVVLAVAYDVDARLYTIRRCSDGGAAEGEAYFLRIPNEEPSVEYEVGSVCIKKARAGIFITRHA